MAKGTHEYVDDPRNAEILISVNGELVPRARAVVGRRPRGAISWWRFWACWWHLSSPLSPLP